VCQTLRAEINHLQNRTEAPTATVDADMLQHTWMELEYRLDIVHMINGAYAECV
jgi:hypothetical protein